MVVHNDKWKKKATREYHRKHGTAPAGRGRGRGQGQAGDLQEESPWPGETEAPEGDGPEGSAESNGDEDEDEEREARKERTKYARRKIEPNAWRFQSDEPDPYLVIDEEAFQPPEPDYAHMQARPFQAKSPSVPPTTSVGRGKKLTMKETELAPLKSRIEKANAARAFKDRFSTSSAPKVLTIGEDGVARRPRKEKEDGEERDSGIDDIDSFLAELDMKGTNQGSVETGKKVKVGTTETGGRHDLDSFVDSLV